jgi:hypothetical protein
MNANELLKSVSNAVEAIDLAPIKARLTNVASGEGWSPDRADGVEREYRRFLCMSKMYPDAELAPYEDVDTFWHYHILDTMKYAADCHQAFGHFLHHCPRADARGDEADVQRRSESGKRLGMLYEATFGEADPVARAGLSQAVGNCICSSQCPDKTAALQ